MTATTYIYIIHTKTFKLGVLTTYKFHNDSSMTSVMLLHFVFGHLKHFISFPKAGELCNIYVFQNIYILRTECSLPTKTITGKYHS